MKRRLFLRIMTNLVAIVLILLTTGTVCAQGRGKGLEKAKAAQEKHTAWLMAQKGVIGTCIGLDDTNEHVVLVLLEHGNVAGVPGHLDGVSQGEEGDYGQDLCSGRPYG